MRPQGHASAIDFTVLIQDGLQAEAAEAFQDSWPTSDIPLSGRILIEAMIALHAPGATGGRSAVRRKT